MTVHYSSCIACFNFQWKPTGFQYNLGCHHARCCL